MWRTYALFFLTILSVPCFAEPPGVHAKPLLRMERARPGELSCVLVQDDGSYRIEQMFRAKADVFTAPSGSIPVDGLQTILANDRLAKLSQADIHDSLIGDTVDAIQLAIFRGSGWQELQLPSPESRKPLKDSIEPLVRWYQEIQKQKPSAIRDSGHPTRCMPQRVTESVTANSLQVAAVSTPVRSKFEYLFKVSSSHAYREVESTCTVVFKDGHFHRERSHQEYMGKRYDKIAEGQVEQTAVSELQGILDSAGLKSAPQPSNDSQGSPVYMQEGSFITLSIPRGDQVQALEFLSAQNTIGNPLEVGGTSNLTYRLPDRKLLDPLLHWMKENTDKLSHKGEIEGAGSDCYPSRQPASSEKPAVP